MRIPRLVALLGIFFAAFVVALVAADQPSMSSPQALAWPATTNVTKPWSRWWWLGNISTEDGLRTQMKRYADAGLGGLEITPIYGVRGYEKQFIDYLSPTWVSRLEFVVREGKRDGLGIDMSTGTGWPFGGPWVGDDTRAKYLAHKIYTVKAGERLAELIASSEQPLARFAGPTRVAVSEIKKPISANTNLQELALDQVKFAQPQPLVALIAFPVAGVGDPGPASPRPAPAAPLDLTSKVGADGKLDWTAPSDGAGAWTLYALFEGWHGKMVERAGPGGEGFAIDYLSHEALADYLKKFSDAFAGHEIFAAPAVAGAAGPGSNAKSQTPGATGPGYSAGDVRRGADGFRGYFNDSYEVDDAQGESNFTPRFLDEFKKRRGYDLRTQLPALFATDGGEISARVLSDYRETVSDLMLDEFTKPWQKWAAARGAIIRNQAHGSPANILDLYAASDIPETEGQDVLAFKMASSAAHVTGKPLASAEACTWLGEHWSSTLGDAKRAVDNFFLGGVNAICYHGTVYSPPDDPWPGFHFYASVEFDPSNAFWDHFGALNKYVERVQSFLQAGEPDEDVLLYYNIHDRWMQRGGGGNGGNARGDFLPASPHFHGGARDGVGASQTARALHDVGIGFDYVSDHLLAGVTFSGGALHAGHATYRAIVVPQTKFMPLETLEKLAALAKAGATVIFQGGAPADVSGFGDLEAHRATFRALSATFAQARDAADGVRIAQAGSGRFVIGADVVKLAGFAGIDGEGIAKQGLQFLRRRYNGGFCYFLLNRGNTPVNDWIGLNLPATARVAMFDPMTGASGMAQTRAAAAASVSSSASPSSPRLQARVQLEPGESCILVSGGDELKGPAFPLWATKGDAQPLNGNWRVEFLRGGPTLPAATQTSELKSWTTFDGDAVKAFAGTARYTLTFARPENASAAEAWSLDLGRVAESARVVLNGTDLGTRIIAPFRVVVPANLLRAQNNVLEIEVANLSANRIADLDRRGVPWKKFYNANMPARIRTNTGPDGMFSAAKWEPRDSGLLGPVTLTPLAQAER